MLVSAKEMLLKASGTYTKDDLMCLVNEIDKNTFDLLVEQSNINIFESSPFFKQLTLRITFCQSHPIRDSKKATRAVRVNELLPVK